MSASRVKTMRTRREIEEQVSGLLKKYSIQQAPVPIADIARQEGLRIVVSAFTSDVSGALLRSGAVAGIAVNANQSPTRKRFTIAHELAHFLLDHRPDEDHLDWEFTVLRRDDRSSEGTDTREIEANAFAANLLMPKELLRKDLTKYLNRNGTLDLDGADRMELARRYNVSDIAMTYRLVNLGFIAPA
jgi:Zn-dependent peptidase ImmA (M78 family)